MSDPLTLPNAVPSAHCDNCGRPCAGTMCEPCLRYELVRPGRLLAYTSSEVDELAEAADAAASYWTGIAAWLRTEAARRAE